MVNNIDTPIAFDKKIKNYVIQTCGVVNRIVIIIIFYNTNVWNCLCSEDNNDEQTMDVKIIYNKIKYHERILYYNYP